MNKTINKTLSTLTGNPLVRNIVLAVCAVIVFIFAVTIMLNLFTRHGKHTTVPNFTGMNITEVQAAAKKASLKVEVSDLLYVPAYEGGLVLDQLPKGGTQVKSGRRILVTINSYNQRMVKVPYVAGYSLRQAKNELQVAGLEIKELIYRTDMATNYVLDQSFNGTPVKRGSDIMAEQGSGITLVVGKSAAEGTTTVPKIVGFPLNEAKSRMWESGLNVGKVTYDDNINLLNQSEARVYSQSPEQGSKLALGETVSFTLTLDSEKVNTGSTRSDQAAKTIAQRLREMEAQQIVTEE